MMEKYKFIVGDSVICNEIKSFYPHGIAPPLKIGKEYTIKSICLDKENNQHLDVGLKMNEEVNFITSLETREILSSPNDEWWCHPSRFYKTNIMHFKHRKTGAILHKDCFNKLPVSQKPHFMTTNEKPTHRYDESVGHNEDEDEDGAIFATAAFVALEAAISDNTSFASAPDPTPDFGGFGGGNGGGGGAGGDF